MVATQDNRVRYEEGGGPPLVAPIWTAARAQLGQLRRLNELLDERDVLVAEVRRLRRFRARPDVRAALRLLDTDGGGPPMGAAA